MNSDNGHLYYGGDELEHEYSIVGDEEGLISLRKAIDEALDKGEFVGGGLGHFSGVKREKREKFEISDEDSGSPDLGGMLILLVLLFVLISAVVGGYTIFKWVFG